MWDSQSWLSGADAQFRVALPIRAVRHVQVRRCRKQQLAAGFHRFH
jgi:hypothetical protein